MPGRSVEARQKLAESVRASLEAIKLGRLVSFSIQIIEINKGTYIKSIVNKVLCICSSAKLFKSKT